MKRTTPLPIIILMLAVVAAIGIAALVAWMQTSNNNQNSSLVVPKVKIGGPIELTDHTGARVTEADFAGRYTMIYFGYTYCPDVCPTELSIMTSALGELAEKNPELEAQITPIFITVDPKRDTVDIMAEYVDNFHDRMVGLTGSSDDTRAAAKAYRVFYSLGEPDEDGDYPVDHSSFLYVMGPDGKYRTMFKHNTDPLKIAEDLKLVIEQDGNG